MAKAIKVDGVSIADIEAELKTSAKALLHHKTWVLCQERQYGRRRAVLTVSGWHLFFEIDPDLVPGRPYWWWQLDRGDNPVQFGKASMGPFYRKTVRECVALLAAEVN